MEAWPTDQAQSIRLVTAFLVDLSDSRGFRYERPLLGGVAYHSRPHSHYRLPTTTTTRGPSIPCQRPPTNGPFQAQVKPSSTPNSNLQVYESSKHDTSGKSDLSNTKSRTSQDLQLHHQEQTTSTRFGVTTCTTSLSLSNPNLNLNPMTLLTVGSGPLHCPYENQVNTTKR